MTRYTIVAVLLAITACDGQLGAPGQAEGAAASQRAEEDEGPPRPHSFGPDTRETEGPHTGQGISTNLLTCEDGSSAGRAFSGYLESDVDRTLLDATLQLPSGVGPFPLVVLLHGWAGSKGSSGDIASRLLSDGYAVLRYSARGFGESWGKVNLSDLFVELRDFQSVVSRVVEQHACDLDAQAVAVTGASYGGGQSWLAAAEPVFKRTSSSPEVRIRTVIPIVPWSDLLFALLPNGRTRQSFDGLGGLKLSYVNALYFSGIREPDEGPQPYYVNYPAYLASWHAWLNASEPTTADPTGKQIVDGLAGYRSIWWQEGFWSAVAVNRVPVFQVQGLTDDLFTLDEAKRMLLALKTVDAAYPIASYFGDLGHPRASNKSGEVDYVLGLIRDWLAYYLKGEGAQPPLGIYAAITRPRDEAFNPGNVITAGTYSELATSTVSEKFPGSALLVNPASDPLGGFFWDPLIMEAAGELKPYDLPAEASGVVDKGAAVYEVEAAALDRGNPVIIAGQPAVTFVASTLAPRVQLNVRLFDVAPDGSRTIITRGTYTLDRSVATIGEVKVTVTTAGNVYMLPNNHRLRLEISNLDTPYITPGRIPSATRISNVRLRVPLR